MTKHTPGPWFTDHLVEPEHMAKCLIDNPTWIAIEDTADDGGHVAYCAPANAPLIAAAPTMLAALERLDLTMLAPGKNAHSPYGTFNEDDEKAIRTAIAKAKGDLPY